MPSIAQRSLESFLITALAGYRWNAPSRFSGRTDADLGGVAHENFHSIPVEYSGNWRSRARENLIAIKLCRHLKTLKRSATTVEKRILFRYTGFGASELVENCFAGIYPRDVPNDIEREIQQLIPADQLDVLVRNLQFAHYTPHWVAKGIWRALSATSFMGGNILEPSIGTGVLVAPLPNHLVSHAGITGVEIDPTTAEIAQLLYPFWHIRNADFINLVFPPIFDLVLANPPIEEVSVRNPTSAPLHELFLAKALTHLAPNGIAIVITTGELLSNGLSVRITNTASLMGAFRLPSDCFGTTSGAAASADLLVFRRHG